MTELIPPANFSGMVPAPDRSSIDFPINASVSADLLEQAIAADITVIDGDGLVGWIAEKIDVLSEQTKRILGICEVPSIVQPH